MAPKRVTTFKEAFEILGLGSEIKSAQSKQNLKRKNEPSYEQPVLLMNDTLMEVESSENNSVSIKNPFTDSESDISIADCSDNDKDYSPSSGHESESEDDRCEIAVDKQTVVPSSMDSTDMSIVFPFICNQEQFSYLTHLEGASTSTHLGASAHLEGASTHLDGASTHLEGSSTHLEGASTHLDGASTHLDGASTHLNSASTEGGSVDEGASSYKWNKHHACIFCHKKVIKMSAHLEKMHSQEPEVIKVLLLKKGSAERRKQWNILLNEGDFQHNVHVLKTDSGKIIPKYRSKNHNLSEYIACPHCKAMYVKNLLATHAKNCSLNEGLKAKKGDAVKAGRLLMPVPKNVSESFYRKVLEKMKVDDISRLIQSDSLLLTFGERCFSSKDLEEHTYGHISGRLRELGRLISCLRRNTSMKVSNLTQALHVKNFDDLLKAVKDLAEFDESAHRFQKGSLALKIGYSLKKLTKILKAKAIKQEDMLLKKQADDFENLFSGDWYDYISASASQSIYRARQNKPRLLPACSDIEKLQHVLEMKLKETNNYATIAKATLCMITLFNRKRGGEVQRMKLEDFQKGMLHGSTASQETLRGLSEAEKKLLEFFSRVEIRGKFNRVVPVLLTSQMICSIRNLISLRESMTPPITSPYLFISKTGSRPYRGSDVIREFANESEVKDSSLFTFTNLRKQIATLSQTIEITKWKQDQLATFLGHDIRVHRNIYRQPIDVLDRAKVAKILMTVNKGISISKTQSVDVDDREELEADSDEDNSDVEFDEEESNVHEGEVPVCHTPDIACERRSNQCFKSTACDRKFKRKVWSQLEVDAVKRNLSYCIAMGRVPRKDEAEKVLAAEPVLRDRNWKNIKDFVYNLIKKLKR